MAQPVGAENAPKRYIVVFNDGVDTDTVVADIAGKYRLAVGHRYRYALKGMSAVIPESVLERVRDDPRVDYIEQDVVITTAAQQLPTGIDRSGFANDTVANIDNVNDTMNVDIAILDTGIDTDHPDLNVFKYASCEPQGPINVVCKEGDADAEDVNSHGTHVAGTAAAIDNDSAVVGVAPGARLWAVKVLGDDGVGSGADLTAGVDYVTKNASQIEVANMSLTGSGPIPAYLDTAISNSVAAGVVYVLAAGNKKANVSGYFPAGHPDAITVSAFADFDGATGGTGSGSVSPGCLEDVDDSFACFSNHGAGVDIMAPGVKIRSTYINGGTSIKSGTSMAAPHVAGAAALYMLQNPGASPAIVKQALLAAGDPAPCANSLDGTCADDPDGIQEPLLSALYPQSIAGDINGDGVVDIRDYQMGLDALFDKINLSDPQMDRADIAPLVGGVPSPDTYFTAGDLLLVRQIILGDLVL